MSGAIIPLVTHHDPAWAKTFELEEEAIRRRLSGLKIELHHIGSTSIPAIFAKPIIDMLGIVEDLSIVDQQTLAFRDLGYEVVGAYGIEGRRYFRKSDVCGQRTHHLHVYGFGHPNIERLLAFRDYLRSHPEMAAQYSYLKARITESGEASSARYIAAKEPFILETTSLALAWHRHRSGHDVIA